MLNNNNNHNNNNKLNKNRTSRLVSSFCTSTSPQALYVITSELKQGGKCEANRKSTTARAAEWAVCGTG